MLWSQITYGHRMASFSPNIVRFYGARTAPGRRQEKSYEFFIIFLDIVRCPVKLRHYLKFHGARMAFSRVIEGKWHRPGTIRRPAGVCTHRTGTGRFLFKIQIVRFQRCPGIIRCLTSARNFQKSLIKLADARPGAGRCGMSRTATDEKRRVFCRSTYCIYIDIPLLKTNI